MSLSEYEQREIEEWSRFVAVRPILVDGVRAFNPGDAVPVSHVTRGVVATEDVRPSDEAPPLVVPEVVHVPRGADAEPDPADVAAAAEANHEAGVE